MLRSRGNRLPSERAARCLALLSFSFYRGGRRACRGSRSIAAAAPRLSPLPLSYSAGRAASRSIARRRYREDPRFFFSLSLSSSSLASARKRIGLERGSLLLSLSRTYPRPIVFIVLWISPPSSATARRAGRRRQSPLPVHTHTYAPRRIVPAENRAFFRTPGRDSSPISFRSPVIN